MTGSRDRLVTLGWVAALNAAAVAVIWIVQVYQLLHSGAYSGEALDVDFSTFWGAARLALTQGPLAPFDVELLNASRGIPAEKKQFTMLWMYPPGWLAVLLPFGLLPYFWAWLLFCILSYTLFAFATRGPARDVPGSWLLLLSAPAVLSCLSLGQNSLIFASLLLISLEALRRQQMLVAGLVIAIMTLKPQLGLAIPIALLAGRYWGATFWAVVGTSAILLASILWPGLGYWPAFFSGMADASERIRDSDLRNMMTSAYGTAYLLGMGRDAALWLQGGITICTIISVAWLWGTRAPFDLKAGGLAFATLLMTPYALYYEMVFALLGCLYLAKAKLFQRRASALIPIAIWVTPVIGFAILSKAGFFFASPLIMIAFALTLFAAWTHISDATGQKNFSVEGSK